MDTQTLPLPRLALTPVELAQSAGVGRTRIFAAINKGELVARKAGTKTTIIEIDAAREWIRNLPTARTAAEPAVA